MASITYPSQHVASYEYSAGGRLDTVRWLGNTFATFTYDAQTGALSTYATGPVTHAFTYDDRHRIDTLTASSTAAPGAMSLDYGYDRSSLVTSIADPRPGHHQTFGYDALGRLTSAEGAYGPLTWSYEPNGDRKTEGRSGAGGSLVYNYHPTSKRLESMTGLASAAFTYGADGRVLTQTAPTDTTTFDYTATSLPVGVSAPGISVTTTPDADEWRVRRAVTTAGGTSTTYSLRSVGSEVLSQFRTRCDQCSREWVSDSIYGAGRLLGSCDADLSDPVVEFTGPVSGNSESWLGPAFRVKVTTATGAPTTAPITVTYATVDLNGGTATASADYTPVAGTFTLPTGTASGANATAIGFATLNDAMDEPLETEAYRDSRRPHFLGGWGRWDVQVGVRRRCVSAPFGW